MIDLRKNIPFLKERGSFFEANREISDLPLDDLKKLYDDALRQSNLDLASSAAEKMSILYGIDGLVLYFNASYLLAQKDIQEHEIIDQDVIKTLSLIFFVENHLPSDFDRQQIEAIEAKFIALCNPNSKDEIISEAHFLCELYEEHQRH